MKLTLTVVEFVLLAQMTQFLQLQITSAQEIAVRLLLPLTIGELLAVCGFQRTVVQSYHYGVCIAVRQQLLQNGNRRPVWANHRLLPS